MSPEEEEKEMEEPAESEADSDPSETEEESTEAEADPDSSETVDSESGSGIISPGTEPDEDSSQPPAPEEESDSSADESEPEDISVQPSPTADASSEQPETPSYPEESPPSDRKSQVKVTAHSSLPGRILWKIQWLGWRVVEVFSSLVKPVGRGLKGLGKMLDPHLQHRVAVSVLAGTLAAILAWPFLGYLQQVIQRPPTEAELSGFLAAAHDHHSKGALAEAEANLRHYLRFASPSVEKGDASHFLAEVLDKQLGSATDRESMLGAENAYQQALQVAPDHEKAPAARLRLANLATALGDHETIAELAQVGFEEDSPEHLLLNGRSALMSGEPAKAERLLSRLLEEYPEFGQSAEAKLDLAEALLAQGKSAEAEKIWKEVEQSHPMDSLGTKAKRQLAAVAEMKGDLDSALEYRRALFARATTQEEKDRARLAIAKLYRKKGDLRRVANEVYQISRGNTGRDGMLLLARAYFEEKRFDDAVQTSEEALTVYPVDEELEILSGKSFVESGLYDRARLLLRDSMSNHPDSAEIHFLYAKAAHLNGSLAAAVSGYKTVAERFPRSPFGYNSYTELSQLLLDEGKEGNAYSVLKQQVSLYFGSSQYRQGQERLGDLYRSCGAAGEAVDVYQSILQRHPRAYEVRYKLGRTMMDQEKWVDALNQLAQIDRSRCEPGVSYNTLLATAEIQRTFGLFNEAEDNLQLALNVPGQKEYRGMVELTRLYMDTEKTGPARSAYAEGKRIAMNAGESGSFYRMVGNQWADYLYLKGDFLTAANVLQETTQQLPATSPKLEWTYFQLGNSYLKLGRREEAAATYDRLATNFPNSQWANLANLKGRYANFLVNREKAVASS